MMKVGIIGAGFWGEKHAQAIAEISNAELVASNRTNKAALDEFTKKYGGRGYTDYKGLLADPQVEAVAIATPHHLHTQIVLEAAKAGKHILLEKPMALNLEECDLILDAVRQAGVTLMVGHTNHFIPHNQKVKILLDSEEYGKPVMAIDRTLKSWWAPNRREWHLDRNLGGGMWMTIGVHNIDRLTWLIGSRVSSVSAQLATSFHNQQADDNVMAFLRYENGVAATVINVGYRTGVTSFDTEIVCTKGIIRIDKFKGILIGRDETWQELSGNVYTDPDSWMEEAMVEEWRAFLTAIENKSQPAVTGEFARHIMAVIFAAEESSRLKREVRIEE